LHFLKGVQGEHVGINLCWGPVVGVASQICIDLGLVPINADARTLMLMNCSQSMAKLMENNLAKIIIVLIVVNPAKVHGRTASSAVIRAVCSEIRPRAAPRVKGDEDIHLCVDESELDVGILSPLRSELLDLVLRILLAENTWHWS
jgi:hypothetical protein